MPLRVAGLHADEVTPALAAVVVAITIAVVIAIASL
jgi:hypothetical protein